jgi:hypothetical protein
MNGEEWGLSLFLLLSVPAWGYDVNGVALGASEAAVREQFPAASCKPLEWRTDAAERRCDDGGIEFGGAPARVTFYLKRDAVQAFDVRFEARDLERVVAHLRQRWGPPGSEAHETIERRGEARELYRMRWDSGAEHAVMTSQRKRRRVDLNVWRGNFDTEIYRMK